MAKFIYKAIAAGGVTVPIYETSSAEQIEWIVGNSGAKLIVSDRIAIFRGGLRHGPCHNGPSGR